MQAISPPNSPSTTTNNIGAALAFLNATPSSGIAPPGLFPPILAGPPLQQAPTNVPVTNSVHNTNNNNGTIIQQPIIHPLIIQPVPVTTYATPPGYTQILPAAAVTPAILTYASPPTTTQTRGYSAPPLTKLDNDKEPLMINNKYKSYDIIQDKEKNVCHILPISKAEITC